MPVNKFDWKKRRSDNSQTRPKDCRDEYERDRSRIIHSSAFRRLQGKTQVLGIGEGDFHRTRLTHSMEAAQISRGLHDALQREYKEQEGILPPKRLLEAICLAHDLGHPPFGHAGEVALNYAMRNHGGFEGNGQTLRILCRLEAHNKRLGLDLTRRTLLGILKYPAAYEKVVKTKPPEESSNRLQISWDNWKPPKCFLNDELEIVDWILEPFPNKDRSLFSQSCTEPQAEKHGKTKYSSLDTSIMTLADDIAYGVHDLEDAIALRLINRDHWDSVVKFERNDSWVNEFDLQNVVDDLFSSEGYNRKQAVGGLVNAFINSVKLDEISNFAHPLLKWNACLNDDATNFLKDLKKLVFDKVILSQQVQTIEYRGQQMLLSLFEAIASQPERLLKESFRSQYEAQSQNSQNPNNQKRVICDYLSGMTDEYATKLYERLFVPRRGTIFEQL
jgi:dGTPase